MKQQIAAVIGAIILSLVLVIGIQQGAISMTDVSAWFTPAILGGIIALLLWGFKDQIEAALKGKPEPQKVEVTNFPSNTPSLTVSDNPTKTEPQNGSYKTNTETEKLAPATHLIEVYSPIHAMIVRINNEIPREQALQGSVGVWVRATLIDFNNISAVFNQHIDKFRDKDLKMWIDIEKEIKAGNGFFLGNDRQKWFDELEAEYKRLKENNKTYRE